MKKREVVGLSLQDLNQYTAHAAHQADVSARKKIAAASNEGSPQEEAKESNAEKMEELGEADGY